LARNLDDKNSKKIKGRVGEDLAFDFLLNNGYDILATNWRQGRAELDIIAYDQNILVFIEVKTRTTDLQPERSVTYKKQKLIISAAARYIETIGWDGDLRFDIIAIIHKNGDTFSIEHFKDAFFPSFDF
jgi:putative endonuclease